MTLSYEQWYPFNIVHQDGTLDGTLIQAANAVANILNLTIDYQKVKNKLVIYAFKKQ